MALQESGEMYLETVYILTRESTQVRAIDVAEHMGYSKPSVSRAMGLLKRDGYVTVNDNGFLFLTDTGLQIADKIYKRHKILTEFLVRLGVERSVAVQDACKIEHYISDLSMAALENYLEKEIEQ